MKAQAKRQGSKRDTKRLIFAILSKASGSNSIDYSRKRRHDGAMMKGRQDLRILKIEE